MSRSSQPIKLYTDRFWISPYVFSCFVALREKGLTFSTVEVALDRGEQRESRFRDRSLTSRVPVLEHGDFSVSESSAILEYLEEAFPAPGHARLLPEATTDRARARQVMAWLRSDLLPLREERPTTTMFYERARAPLTTAGQAAAEKLLHTASRLLDGGKRQLFGDWSIADTDLAIMLGRLVLNRDDVPAALRAFFDAQWSRPSVQAYVERDRPTYVPYG